jgi:hypothetical protein
MLAGDAVSDAVRASAKEMLALARAKGEPKSKGESESRTPASGRKERRGA